MVAHHELVVGLVALGGADLGGADNVAHQHDPFGRGAQPAAPSARLAGPGGRVKERQCSGLGSEHPQPFRQRIGLRCLLLGRRAPAERRVDLRPEEQRFHQLHVGLLVAPPVHGAGRQLGRPAEVAPASVAGGQGSVQRDRNRHREPTSTAHPGRDDREMGLDGLGRASGAAGPVHLGGEYGGGGEANRSIGKGVGDRVRDETGNRIGRRIGFGVGWRSGPRAGIVLLAAGRTGLGRCCDDVTGSWLGATKGPPVDDRPQRGGMHRCHHGERCDRGCRAGLVAGAGECQGTGRNRAGPAVEARGALPSRCGRRLGPLAQPVDEGEVAVQVGDGGQRCHHSRCIAVMGRRAVAAFGFGDQRPAAPFATVHPAGDHVAESGANPLVERVHGRSVAVDSPTAVGRHGHESRRSTERRRWPRSEPDRGLIYPGGYPASVTGRLLS